MNPPVSVPSFIDENGFDDHSVPSVATVDDSMVLARVRDGGASAIKFVLPKFDRPLDARFAALITRQQYDEWAAQVASRQGSCRFRRRRV